MGITSFSAPCVSKRVCVLAGGRACVLACALPESRWTKLLYGGQQHHLFPAPCVHPHVSTGMCLSIRAAGAYIAAHLERVNGSHLHLSALGRPVTATAIVLRALVRPSGAVLLLLLLLLLAPCCCRRRAAPAVLGPRVLLHRPPASADLRGQAGRQTGLLSSPRLRFMLFANTRLRIPKGPSSTPGAIANLRFRTYSEVQGHGLLRLIKCTAAGSVAQRCGVQPPSHLRPVEADDPQGGGLRTVPQQGGDDAPHQLGLWVNGGVG